MTKKIIQACNIIMEITWLLALVSIPIYFNIYTSRVFEPDKISLFRCLVLIMVVAWIGKGLAKVAADWDFTQASTNWRRNKVETVEVIYPEDGDVIGPDTRSFPQTLRRPLMPFTAALCFIYLVSTIFSVVPGISWWGSYQRLQGTYTFLSYVTFFLVMMYNIRERRQIERLISFVLLANIPVALYGLLQHFNADPLQWQGDVVFRVTSTMGNAIFISAYLLMVTPLIAYRAMTTGQWLLVNRYQASRFFKGRQRDTALSWVALYGCFMLFVVGVFFVVLNFNANYHPDANSGIAQASSSQLLGTDSGAAEARQLIGNSSVGPWWALPLGIIISFSLFFLFTIRRRGTDVNYLFRLFEFGSYLILMIIVLTTIFFSQSRGPEAGLLVAMYIFFPIVFWRRKAWKWLLGWIGIGVVFGGTLFLFNLPPNSTPLEPIFKIARQNDQLARLGTFLSVDDGTGEVRQLIWKTVLELMGSSDPTRLAIGYGPESLYNEAPEHYQPNLAHVEARNAIPDRSHNGYLDALETTGIVGLALYIIFVLAFFYTAIKFLRRTERFDYQVLIAALMAIMAGHQIEIQTGIQIVSTWMMFWTVVALLALTGGLIYGSWDKVGAKRVAETPEVAEPVVEEVPTEEAEPVAAIVAGKPKRKKRHGVVAAPMEEPVPVMATTSANGKKGTVAAKAAAPETANAAKTGGAKTGGNGNKAPNRANPTVAAAKPNNRRNGPIIANAFTEPAEYITYDRPIKPWFWAGIGVAAIAFIYYAWIGNITPIIADTIYKQGANLAAANQWTQATPFLENATILAPNEDFYSLYLGQAYLEIAQGQTSNKDNMNYYLKKSEAELQRANKLAPLNPDHYANLARLYSQWASLDPTQATALLTKSENFYKEVVTVYSPRNARLWSEYASAEASLATNLATNGTPDKTHLDASVKAAEMSVQIDDNYDFGRLVLGDIYRFAGQNDAAGLQYLALAQIDPSQLSGDDRYQYRMQALATSKQVPAGEATNVFASAKSNYLLTPAIASTMSTLGLNALQLQATGAAQTTAYTNRGIVEFYQNNLPGAMTDLLSGDQSNAYTHAYLSLVYKNQGQATQAQTEAAQARSLAGQATNKDQLQPAIERVLAG